MEALHVVCWMPLPFLGRRGRAQFRSSRVLLWDYDALRSPGNLPQEKVYFCFCFVFLLIKIINWVLLLELFPKSVQKTYHFHAAQGEHDPKGSLPTGLFWRPAGPQQELCRTGQQPVCCRGSNGWIHLFMSIFKVLHYTLVIATAICIYKWE